MVKILFLFFFFFFAILFEASLFSIPFALPFLLLFFVLHKKPSVFAMAFIIGLILDILHIRPLGMTSLFYLLLLLIVLLYDRKFEVISFPFLIGATVVSVIIYSILFSTPFIFGQIFFLSGMTAGGFFIYQKFFKKQVQSSSYRHV